MSAVNPDKQEGTEEREHAEHAIAAVDSIEAYESDDGIVLYDALNPLAWIQSSTSIGLPDAR